MYLYQIIHLYNDSQGTSSEQALCRLFLKTPQKIFCPMQSRATLKSSHPFLYDYHPVLLELGYIFVNIYNDGNPGKIIMLRMIISAKKTKRLSSVNILSSL